MRILLSIEHPAWAHQFHYIIKELEKQGHTVKVVAINKDRDLELLNAFQIKYEVISNTPGNNSYEKALIFLSTTISIFFISLKFRPDLYIGRASPMITINNFILRKKHVVFDDSEPSKFLLLLCKLFSNIIITPKYFSLDLGKKQVRIDSYKELFYLHPKYFHPKPDILNYLNIKKGERLILVRFVSWTAHHDTGQHGIISKSELIHKLEKYGKVFISSEKPLTNELEKYKLKVPIERIHDVLSYADIFISDSQTMTTEAAMLGTPAIRCNSFVGKKDMSNFNELEKRYKLIYNVNNEKDIIKITSNLLNDSDLKSEWNLKRNKLLVDKIDPTKFFLDTINKYL
jgi:predicted glycosyltransferase